MQHPARTELWAILRLAGPLIASQLAHMLMVLTDTLMMARLSPQALAGGGLGAASYSFVSIFCIGVIAAVGTLVAIRQGAGDIQGAARLTQAGLWLAWIMALVAGLLLWNLKPLLLLFGQTESNVQAAGQFLLILPFALPGYLSFMALRGFTSAIGRATPVMVISLAGTVANFLLNYALITGMFGLIGSGRTEVAKIISGVVKRNFFNGGEIRLRDRSVRYRVPRQAVQDGIVYVTEDRKIEGFFETMTIPENLYMGALAAGLTSSAVVNMTEMRALAADWTKTLNIKAINSNARVIELSGGNQQKVVISKSLVQKPKVIIFDEPTRGVDVGAIAEIHAFINRLADEGLAIVVISSYLPEVMNLSDRILVCRSGRVVEEFAPSEATEEKIMYAAVH